MDRKSATGFAGGVTLLLAVMTANADVSPVEIGLGGFEWELKPAAMNEHGQVAGTGRGLGAGSSRAFSWTAQSGVVNLGTLVGYESAASHVTSAGRVFGYEVFVAPPNYQRSYAFQSFSWTAEDGMASIEPFYGAENFATAVSTANGQLVGYSCNDEHRNDS